MNCVFCQLEDDRIAGSSDYWLIIRDGFPVSDGHTLILPRRHVGTFIELDAGELSELPGLIQQVSKNLKSQYSPAGFNIGINDGLAAGQTVPHLHVHVIPRYAGDVEDPRGGVRWVKPDKAKYW